MNKTTIDVIDIIIVKSNYPRDSKLSLVFFMLFTELLYLICKEIDFSA